MGRGALEWFRLTGAPKKARNSSNRGQSRSLDTQIFISSPPKLATADSNSDMLICPPSYMRHTLLWKNGTWGEEIMMKRGGGGIT